MLKICWKYVGNPRHHMSDVLPSCARRPRKAQPPHSEPNGGWHQSKRRRNSLCAKNLPKNDQLNITKLAKPQYIVNIHKPQSDVHRTCLWFINVKTMMCNEAWTESGLLMTFLKCSRSFDILWLDSIDLVTNARRASEPCKGQVESLLGLGNLDRAVRSTRNTCHYESLRYHVISTHETHETHETLSFALRSLSCACARSFKRYNCFQSEYI